MDIGSVDEYYNVVSFCQGLGVNEPCWIGLRRDSQYDPHTCCDNDSGESQCCAYCLTPGQQYNTQRACSYCGSHINRFHWVNSGLPCEIPFQSSGDSCFGWGKRNRPVQCQHPANLDGDDCCVGADFTNGDLDCSSHQYYFSDFECDKKQKYVCEIPTAVGACCTRPGSCQETCIMNCKNSCDELGGTWLSNSDCSDASICEYKPCQACCSTVSLRESLPNAVSGCDCGTCCECGQVAHCSIEADGSSTCTCVSTLLQDGVACFTS